MASALVMRAAFDLQVPVGKRVGEAEDDGPDCGVDEKEPDDDDRRPDEDVGLEPAAPAVVPGFEEGGVTE